MLITVDCGTTNMRCRLFDNGTLICEVKRTAGCRNTAFTGSDNFLREALRDSLSDLAEKSGVGDDCIEAVICSGTLASDVGIYHIPHAIAPAGVNETVAAASMTHMPDLTQLPIFFIPGIKTLPAPGEKDLTKFIEALESMSGEDCETYGIMSALGLTGDFVITLPGSHTKVMEVDAQGRIISIRTGICGEFIAAISGHTMLHHSLPDPVIRKSMPEYLLTGFEYARTHGVSPSLVKARSTQLFGGWDADMAANFFVGALLKDDIMSVFDVCGTDRKLIVGGGNPLRHVFAVLLEHVGAANLIEIDDETARLAPSRGAMMVYETWKRKNINNF